MSVVAEPITVTLFGAAWAPEPTHEIRGTWRDLVDGIRAGLQRTVPAPRDDSEKAWKNAKRNLPAMVCAPFSGSRGDDTVGDHTAVVLDVDRPTPATLERLQRYQAIAYESPSSRRKGGDDIRLRVVVAISAPVPPHAVEATRAALAVELGLDPQQSGVAGADAASQLMFYGRIDGTPEREMWTYDGEPWTPPPPGEAPPRRERLNDEVGASVSLWSVTDIPNLSVLAEAVGTLDENGMRRGGREVSRAIGGMLAKLGWHPEAIYQAVGEQIPSDDPWGKERAEAARDAADQFYRGQANTIGYGELEKRFGAEVMVEIDASLDPCTAVVADMIRRCWPPPRHPANDTVDSEPTEHAPTTEGLLWISAADLAKPLRPVTWMCQRLGLAVGGRPHVFAARAGAGKTMSAQALGLAVATGGKLFGEFECRKGVVRHIDLDQGQQATQRRYQWLAAGLGVDLREVPDLACSFFGFSLTAGAQISAKALSLLERSVRGADLVIVDALRSLAPGLDENASEFGAVLAALSAVTNETGVTWLVLHHSGKSDAATFRGTTAIEDRLGSGWELRRGNSDQQTVWCHTKRSELACEFELPFTTRLVKHLANGREAASISVEPESDRATNGEPTAGEQRAIAAYVNEHPDGVSQTKVEMALRGRVARDRVRDVIEVMCSDHVLVRQGSNKTSRLLPGPAIAELLA